MEPFGALFDQDGLKAVDMPVLLYRAERSDLKADGGSLALAKSLPRQPRQESTAGVHLKSWTLALGGEGEAPAMSATLPTSIAQAFISGIRSEMQDFLLQHAAISSVRPDRSYYRFIPGDALPRLLVSEFAGLCSLS